jgi:hypothetical protein
MVYSGCTTVINVAAVIGTPASECSIAAPARDLGVFGSGDSAFDRALAYTLVSISQTFSVQPGFVFSEHIPLDPVNAFASPDRALGQCDGSVVFGRPLYRRIMSGGQQHPELGIACVCAHEFGHIAQFKNSLYDRLVFQKIVNGQNRHFVKRLELHADFLAGYFAGRRKLERSDFPAAVFALTQYNFGDNAYGDPGHHGTEAERGQAVVAGFDTAYRAQQSFEMALETGVRYVQQITL